MSEADRLALLSPRNTVAAMREKHGRSDGWYRFARFLTKNEFLRTYLRNRGRFRCELCRELLPWGKFVIHHVDYDHECGFSGSLPFVPLMEGSTDHGRKAYPVPDCEACRVESAERFLACASRLAAVHFRCNWKLGG